MAIGVTYQRAKLVEQWDAIVIGSEHRSRLQAAIGTVTEELLKAAAVPVIAVP